MSISWVLLTYNRANSVTKAIPHCMKNAGMQWDEMIWVDNGSSSQDVSDIDLAIKFNNWDGWQQGPMPVKRVMFPKNLGVAKGYNIGMALASCEYIVITGCDMLMPDNWLKNMYDSLQKIENAGIATIYAAPIESTPERIRGEPREEAGFKIQPSMPIGRRMLKRSLQREIGYFNEGFGMYGWDDVAWGHTAERICKEKGLLSYNLIDQTAEHLGTEGNVGYDHKDEHAYWLWKKEEVEATYKRELMDKLLKQNWPTFNPF